MQKGGCVFPSQSLGRLRPTWVPSPSRKTFAKLSLTVCNKRGIGCFNWGPPVWLSTRVVIYNCNVCFPLSKCVRPRGRSLESRACFQRWQCRIPHLGGGEQVCFRIGMFQEHAKGSSGRRALIFIRWSAVPRALMPVCQAWLLSLCTCSINICWALSNCKTPWESALFPGALRFQ